MATSSLQQTFTPAAGSVTGASTASGSWAFGKNALINGAFEVWQRGTSFAAAATGDYTADRWTYAKSGAMVHTLSRSTDVPTVAQAGVLAPYSLLIDVTTADASIGSTDFCYVAQKIEGYSWRHFAQRALTLTFWVKATKTGVYTVFLQNSGNDRSLAVEYTISATDTWEKKTVTIPASPSAGTWDYTTGIGTYLGFNLAVGSNYNGLTSGTWASSNNFSTTNQVNGTDSTDNNFRLALVQLEVGSAATDFEFVPYVSELARCQRYFTRWASSNTSDCFAAGQAYNTTNMLAVLTHRVPMRTNPTLSVSSVGHFSVSGAAAAVTVCTAIVINQPGPAASMLQCTIGTADLVAGNASILIATSASGTIDLSAEL